MEEILQRQLSLAFNKAGAFVKSNEMTADQVFEYLHWTNSLACQVAFDFGGKILRSGKLIGIDGQKTVCFDSQLPPTPSSCTIYSFGIANEWSFDKMFEAYGCQVYAFDPSMNKDDFDYTPNIHFYNLGIAHVDTDNSDGWKMRTLHSIYEMLQPKHGPVTIDYLKVDVEGYEWEIIPLLLQSGMLDIVKQMGFELHFLSEDNDEYLCYEIAWYNTKYIQ